MMSSYKPLQKVGFLGSRWGLDEFLLPGRIGYLRLFNHGRNPLYEPERAVTQ